MRIEISIVKIMFLLLICLINASCQSKKDDYELDQALKLAGDNRVELEKLLKHYENDSLKLEAAEFLIRNMPRQYSVLSWGVDSCKSIIKNAIQIGYLSDSAKLEGQTKLQAPKEIVLDIEIITAKYLIENIDLSFKVWKDNPWNHKLSFDNFCESILPYRIEDEPLSNWRQLYYNRYKPILDSLYQGDDAVVACDSLCKYLTKEGFFYNTDFSLPHYAADFLLESRFGTCRDGCDIGVYVMRALGIPVAIDILPYSPEYQLGHLWNVMYDIKTDKWLPFWYTQFSPERNDNFTDGRKKGKVYRKCYGIQLESSYPDKRNRRMKDVTAEYFGENRVEIKIEAPKASSKTPAYLGVFSSSGWRLVTSGYLDKKNNVAIFEDLEPRVIYQPLYIIDNQLQHFNYPFMMLDNENVRFFEPNKKEKQKVILKRKYPLRQSTVNYRHNMLGAIIEGSSDSRFRNPQIIYEIEDTIRANFNKVSTQTKTPYRYIRYSSASDKRLEMGEVEFLREDDSRISVVKITSNTKLFRQQPHFNVENCIDGDPLSFYSHHELGKSIFFEFEQPESIYKIVFIPRNDDNFIRVGDEYELFYNDGIDGWKSLGTQIASSITLIYNNVPSGALFWLKNKTRGREEQAFSYENNRQRFGTFDEYENRIIIE